MKYLVNQKTNIFLIDPPRPGKYPFGWALFSLQRGK